GARRSRCAGRCAARRDVRPRGSTAGDRGPPDRRRLTAVCPQRAVRTPRVGDLALLSRLERAYLPGDLADTARSWPMTVTETPVNNGVNVEALLAAREALTAAPEAANFQWRATCEWQNGTHSNSTVEGFFGLGEEQSHRTRYSFDVDHPEIFASEDNGATPVELVLVGLVGCLTAGVAAVAQNREIQLRRVSATIEGAMDVRGILGVDSDVRNGFSGIKVTYDIDADATPAEIKAIVAQSQKRSAVYDII